jgi:hypothetical protein
MVNNNLIVSESLNVAGDRVIREPKEPRIMMHAAGKSQSICKPVDRHHLNLCYEPESTATYKAIPQIELVDMASDMLTMQGYNLSNWQHFTDAIQPDSDAYKNNESYAIDNKLTGRFVSVVAATHVQFPDVPEYDVLIAIMNSTSKEWRVRFGIGSQVFACDNTCLSADIVLNFKHTAGNMGRIRGSVFEAIHNVPNVAAAQSKDINNMKQVELSDDTAVNMIVNAYRSGIDGRSVLDRSRVLPTIEQWYDRDRNDGAYESRTAWSLLNAFTEDAKSRGMITRAGQTLQQHRYIANECDQLMHA